MKRRTPGAGSVVAIAAVFSCSPGGDLAELRRILASDREAHLSANAGQLAAHLADSVVVLDGGDMFVQTRDEIEAMFGDYLSGATYREWDDIEEPVIRISSDGGLAWVARRVRVDRTGPRFGGGTTRERFESSWVATYEAADGSWRMTSVASTFAREPSASTVLAAARRALGGDGAVAGARFVRFDADASGPGGAYRVTVQSGAEGGARVDFSTGFSAAIDRDAGWVRTEAEPTAMSDTLETFVRGHELVMNALRPESRYGELRFAGEEKFGDVPAIRLDGVDALGAPIQFYYSVVDTLPLGYLVVDHLRGRDPVATTFSEWRSFEGLRLPTRTRFVQEDEVFVYEMSDIAVADTVPPGAFAPDA